MEGKCLHRWMLHAIIMMVGLCTVTNLTAQTDVMFTKYQFNSLAFNPGYAGSKEFMTMNVLHRTQWLGIKGAPSAQTFTIHTPLKGFDRLGLGATIFNQSVGVNQSMGINLSYAYRIRLGDDPSAGSIAVGMQGGIMNWRANFSKLNTQQGEDFPYDEASPNLWLPNFGAGIYMYTKYYYFGVSSPNILEHDLRNNPESLEMVNAKTFRHYYAIAGGAIPFSDGDVVFKPSVLYKRVALLSRFNNEESLYRNYASPSEMTLDLSLLLRQKIWFGVAYRFAVEQFNSELTSRASHDSFDAWVTYYVNKKLYFGVAYDYSITPVQDVSKGSFEVSLGYDFNYNTTKTYSPRYF